MAKRFAYYSTSSTEDNLELAGDVQGEPGATEVTSLLGTDVDAALLPGIAKVIATNGTDAFWFPSEGGSVYYADMIPGVVPGGADCTGPVQAFINGTMIAGDTLVFGEAVYGFTNLYIDQAATGVRSINIVGRRGGSGGTRFLNRGTDITRPMFHVAAGRCHVQNITFQGNAAGGRQCLSLVDVGGLSNNGNGVAFNRFSNCVFDSYTATEDDWGTGALVTLCGYQSYTKGEMGVQVESTVFHDCSWVLKESANTCVRIGYAGQPFSTVFAGDCSMFGGNEFAPWGRGVWVDNCLASSLLFCGMVEIQQMEELVHINGQGINVYVAGLQSETVKRLCTVSGSGSSTFMVDGGRWNVINLDAATSGPSNYAADDRLLASITGRHTLVIRGLVAGGLATAVRNARIYLSDKASLDFDAGRWPDRELVQRDHDTEPDEVAFTRVCTQYYGQGDGYGRVFESQDEAENAPGVAGIYGTQTEITVPLPRYESGANYAVEVTPLEYIGSPAAGSTSIRGLPVSSSSVRFVADAAPGAGNGVRFSYRIRHGAPLVVSDPTDIRGCVLHLDGTGMAESGGSLTGWVDNTSARSFTPTGTIAYTASDADFNGEPSFTLADNTELLTSDEAASAWAFASNGTDGYFVYAVFYTAAGSVAAEVFTTTGTPGYGFNLRTASRGQLRMSYTDTYAGYTFSGLPVDGRRWLAGGYEGGQGLNDVAAPRITLRASGPDSSRGVYTAGKGNFDGATPTNTLTIRGDSSDPVKFAEIGMYNRYPSAYEQEALIAYIEKKYNGFAQS